MPFIVQNLSMSSSDQLYVSTVIGSGAPLTIQTNESWTLPPSLSLHISMTENRGSFFLLKKCSLSSSQCLCISATCCLLCERAPALDAVSRSPVCESHTANLGVRLVATLFSFFKVLGIVRTKLSGFFEIACGLGIMTCLSPSKEYWIRARFSVSSSLSVQIEGNINN